MSPLARHSLESGQAASAKISRADRELTFPKADQTDVRFGSTALSASASSPAEGAPDILTNILK
jgi:hypothetical protein